MTIALWLAFLLAPFAFAQEESSFILTLEQNITFDNKSRPDQMSWIYLRNGQIEDHSFKDKLDSWNVPRWLSNPKIDSHGDPYCELFVFFHSRFDRKWILSAGRKLHFQKPLGTPLATSSQEGPILLCHSSSERYGDANPKQIEQALGSLLKITIVPGEADNRAEGMKKSLSEKARALREGEGPSAEELFRLPNLFLSEKL